MTTSLRNILNYSEISKNLLIGILLLWITTFVHHLYGAYVYSTLWRSIAPTIIFPIILFITLILFNKFIETNENWQKIFFSSIVLLLWIIPIGFIEGGYGHVLKNIMFLLKANVETIHKMFPPEFGETRLFESPNDIFFEITGVFQFFIGLITLVYLVKFLNRMKRSHN